MTAHPPSHRPHLRSPGLEARIAALATRQHGIVSAVQLVELGLGERSVRRRSAEGALLRIHQGVYAVGHRPRTPQAPWMAAVLACGPGAVVSHHDAAVLLGFGAPVGSPVHVTATTKGRSQAGILRHWTRRLLPFETTLRHGIPVTTPQRTAIDLADVLTDNASELALRSAERRKLLDRSRLRPIHGRRGAARVRRRTDPIRSPLEARFKAFLIRHSFPLPDFNAELEDLGEVDAAWPVRRLVVELDSWEHHGNRHQFETDRERRARLVADGWRVVEVTHRMLETEPVDLFHTLFGGP